MTPERWQQVNELFKAALERAPGERAAFLDRACSGDEPLREEIESLLSSYEQGGSFLEAPAVAAAADSLLDGQAESLVGRALGRYQVVALLGEGGMGEVYLAEDLMLGRRVALKLLPPSFVADPKRVRRFAREARAASALNHPNILTIHEVGEVAGRHFIATEYVEGVTLRERLAAERLSLIEALDIAAQMASALAAAHAAGVIHRDLKPENVMLRRDGILKVLDWGLAKLAAQPRDAAAQESPTQVFIKTDTGVVMGTPCYMSPEQARGLAVDARTDIWSLGVVLYEMITRRVPFAGDTAGDVLVSVLEREPAPLASLTPDAPAEFQRIITKALRKDREERYQGIKDLLVDLKALRQESELQAKLRAIAQESVVPTEALTTNAQALTTNVQALTTAEQAIPPVKPIGPRLVSGIRARRLFVASALAALVIIVAAFYLLLNNHRSAFSEKDTILLADFINTTGDATFDGSTLKQALAVQLRQTPFLNLYPEEGVHETLRYMGRTESERITPQIGREICRRRGLKALLIGTISALGHHYVITLEAVNGVTGETIASQQLEAESKEQVLRSLGQAALDLRKQLGESLSTLQRYNAPIEQATTSSLEALNVYSKGLEEMYRGDAKAALPLFNRAVELDPNFAEAYLWLSWTYANFGDQGKAGDFAAKAYTLRDRVTELEKLHIEEIYHLFTTGDFEKQKEADGLIKRLYPNDSLAPASLGYGYKRIGQLEQALTEFREAIRINPDESHYYINVSEILLRLNRFDDARETIKQARARNLDHPDYRRDLYLIGLAQGDDAEAQQQLAEIRKMDGEADALTAEAGAAIFFGRWRKAQELYHRAAALSGTASPSGANAALPVEATIAGALFGFCQPAADGVRQALATSRINSPVTLMYVPVLANGSLCGDAGAAQKLADEQLRRYPNATLLHLYSEPIIRAAATLQRDSADQAIEFLNAAISYEGGDAGFWPSYLRGQAYLRLRRGAEAAAEFQKILDHRGWDPVSPMYPLAHVGLARAAALAGDAAKARRAYLDFLALWRDADPDIPILIEAKKEYEQLK